MQWEPIRKTPAEQATANVDNYAWLRHDFSWAHAREWLSGLPQGRGLNIGYEAVDRQLTRGLGDKVALRCLGRRGEIDELTYAELVRRTNRFANLLGAARGERVFALPNRGVDLYATALGTLKYTAVTARGPTGGGRTAPSCG